MRKVFLSLATTFFIIVTIATAQSKDELAIKKALNEQLAAWNAWDVNRFMGTYWQGDSLMFIGKKGLTYRWQNTLENYKKNYPDTAAMGKLDFTILETKHLSVLYFFCGGQMAFNP